MRRNYLWACAIDSDTVTSNQHQATKKKRRSIAYLLSNRLWSIDWTTLRPAQFYYQYKVSVTKPVLRWMGAAEASTVTWCAMTTRAFIVLVTSLQCRNVNGSRKCKWMNLIRCELSWFRYTRWRSWQRDGDDDLFLRRIVGSLTCLPQWNYNNNVQTEQWIKCSC